MNARLHSSLVTASAAAVLLVGCGTMPIDYGPISVDPQQAALSTDELAGIGTVLQQGETPAMFCLGVVLQSYPPQCSGPDIANWTWEWAEGNESASGTTWGTYALQGRWDGTEFTVTQPPIMLALYDPPARPDPLEDPANAGGNEEGRLLTVQAELDADPTVSPLMSWPANGYLFVLVVHDDGELQDHVDDLYGEGVVAIRSALRPVER